ncbi:hypothetical protein V2J09_020402 [Rumex salicifolius]
MADPRIFLKSNNLKSPNSIKMLTNSLNCSPTQLLTNDTTALSIQFLTIKNLKPASNLRRFFSKTIRSSSNMTNTAPYRAPPIFGFQKLTEIFTVDVHRAEGRPLVVPLKAPFTIANSRLEVVENVGIRVELSNGTVGWGEAPILPSVTAEDQATALAKAAEACQFLKMSSALTLGAALGEIGQILPGHAFASVRAGMEMALIDAVANSIRIPLWRLYGAVSDTIPIVSEDEATKLASGYQKQGFKTLKLKVGKDLNADIKVLQAIRKVFPECTYILDANEGYTPREAVEVLQKLHEMGVTPALFEQPVHRDDWEGLGHVSSVAKEKYGVSVAADESCRSVDDAERIIKENLAHVINIKLAKLGVLGALGVAEMARESGLDLMIGGMVETRLAMGFAGHLAAGMGCFKYIDLDTPLLMAEDPVLGGYEVMGPVYRFTNARGHGGFLHWDNLN